ncbi:MAG: flagellar basal body-associated FliL family protein [Phycisphaeraceae bacterium]|jgi:flagellar basal body-associated protein FliL
MAEEDTTQADAPAKKKLPMKMIIILAVVMVVEGVIFGAGYFIFGDKPPTVHAEGLQVDPKADEFKLVEVLLIGDKFQNTRQGAQAYLYDATIYVEVQKRHETEIEMQIEEQMARISQEVTEVFARAEPAQLNEPDRLTLKRQILDKCKERFGDDADGDPYVRNVVISNWKRFSTDL